MRRLGLVFACLIAVAMPFALGAGSALARSGNNCPGGAGDNQYVDPLGGCHTGSTPTPPPTNPTPPPTTTPTTQPATVASTTTVSTTSGHDPGSHSSLPRTGLDVLAAVALGLGLLGTGIAVRRSLARGS